MLIYNSLSRKKEEFVPLNDKNVTMYVCGPTVYDFFHIGNARTFVSADIIRKYLEYKGYNVTFAMNLTDVDDKIIKKANEENVDASVISEKYINLFFEDITKLKIKKADIYPKATEHMDDMIQLVKNLEEKDIAYNVEGNVFYDVTKFEGYGKLSGKKIDELESGSRIEINEVKRNPMDFSLWKKAKDGEPAWESPWGKGRPGWHLECSAMSMKHLGKTIDIHAGGNDLIFPHHENEIAQSEACCTPKFVNYWMHFGFLNLQNEKMSKSSGNFFTTRDILKKYSAEAIRLLFAQSNYSGPLNFSDELLDAAVKGLEKIQNFVTVCNEGISLASSGEMPEFSFDASYKKFESVMDDDFNSPKALAVIFDFVKNFNKAARSVENPNMEFFVKGKEFIEKTAEGVLGIVDFSSGDKDESSIEDEVINLLLDIRLRVKQEKNYQMADDIRNKLNELGIEIKDTKDGSTFRKK